MAMLLYGFPPNVGATGTAALLNVPKVSQCKTSTRRDVSATAQTC